MIDLVPALTITKTASVSTATPGSTVGYTITVDNTGQTPYTGASVTDSLAGVLDDAAYNNNAAAIHRHRQLRQPGADLDRRPRHRPDRHHHLHRHRANPDTGSRVLANTAVSAATGSTCPSGSTSPGCTATVTVVSGVLSITAPASASLGSADPGGTISANLGTVQVTDGRGFGASWTATVATTAFTTGRGTPPETIPAGDASYAISALSQTTGSATFTFVPLTNLSVAPQAVVTATNVAGNTSAILEPADQHPGTRQRDRRHLHGHDHPLRVLSAVPDRHPARRRRTRTRTRRPARMTRMAAASHRENADGIAGQRAGAGRGGPAARGGGRNARQPVQVGGADDRRTAVRQGRAGDGGQP